MYDSGAAQASMMRTQDKFYSNSGDYFTATQSNKGGKTFKADATHVPFNPLLVKTDRIRINKGGSASFKKSDGNEVHKMMAV